MQPAQYMAWNHLAMCECGCKLHGVALLCIDVQICTKVYDDVLAECSVAATVLSPADGGLRVAATERMH